MKPSSATKIPTFKYRRGGVLALAKTGIKTHLESAKFIVREAQLVQFVFNGITIFGVYKNPTRSKACSRAIIRYFGKQIIQLGDWPFLITGDMNLPTLEADFDPPLNPVQDPLDMTNDNSFRSLLVVFQPLHLSQN